MFNLIFGIIRGFLLAILREIPAVFFDGLFYGLFYGSVSKTHNKERYKTTSHVAFSLICLRVDDSSFVFRGFDLQIF